MSSKQRSALPHDMHLKRAFLVALFVALAGCSRPMYGQRVGEMSDTTPRPSTEVRPEEVRTDDQAAAAAFDEGVEAWSRGEFRRASDHFRYFLADFPEDPLATRAEAYLGRSLLAAGDPAGARRVFSDMATGSAERDVQRLGALYLAFSDAVDEGSEAGIAAMQDALRRQPDLRVQPGFPIDGDVPLLASLLAEARIASSAYREALADLEVVQLYAEDEAMGRWATARAQTLVREHLSPAEQVALIQSDASFERAVTVETLVQAYLRAGDYESARRALELAGQAMLAHGMEPEYAQVQNLVAAATGERARTYGALLSLSGPDRRAGRAALGGILLAQGAFSERTPTSTVFIEDTEGDIDATRRALDSLAERGVPVVIGPLESSLAAVARPYAEELGLAYIGLDPMLDQSESEDTWQLTFSPVDEARALARLAREQGAQRFAIIRQERDSAYLDAFAEAVREAARTLGVEVVSEARIDAEATQDSARSAANRLAASRPDAIFFATTANATAVMANWLASEGIWPVGSEASGRLQALYLGNSFAWGREVSLNSSRWAEGMYFAQWLELEGGSRSTQSFVRDFQSVYGREPGAVEGFAHDAAGLARFLVVDEGLRDPDAMQERLRRGVRLYGALGEFEVGAAGTRLSPSIVRLRGGELQTP